MQDLESETTRAHLPCIAAIDVGTNSCRLLVGTVSIVSLYRNFFKLKHMGDHPMRIVDAYSRIVGLGEGVKQTGLLSQEAMDRTLETLTICRERMDLHHVGRMRAVATEACRQAKNADILVQRILEETGIHLEVIPPEEEARLVLWGCMHSMSGPYEYGFMIDIGGGSTEIIWLKINQQQTNKKAAMTIVDSISLPFGVVTLRDTYEHGGAKPEIYQATRDEICQRIQAFIRKNGIRRHLNANEVQVVASSGTVTTLASLVLKAPRYERHLIDGKDFSLEDLRHVTRQLIAHRGGKGGSAPAKTPAGIGDDVMKVLLLYPDYDDPARMGLLVAGSVILDAILAIVRPVALRVADRGAREGILRQLAESYRESEDASSSVCPYTVLNKEWE